MDIAFFDFDGTVTTKDSMVDFIQYAIGKRKYYLGLIFLSKTLIAYKLKLISNHIAKERLISHYFKDWDTSKFKTIANQYSLEKIDTITRDSAIKKIKWHQQNKHKVVIVSASIDVWLEAWCKKNDITLIATQLKIKNNKLTGEFDSKNCYGIEKVSRIKEVFDLNLYKRIYVYGDSSGDKEMLAIASERFYKLFRD